MKPKIVYSLLVLFIFLTGGCTMINYSTQTENGYRIWTFYSRPKKPTLWLERVNYWENIGFADATKPKKPALLLREETTLMIDAGQPKKFIGHITGVLIWIADGGPYETQHSGGKFYFHLSTRNKWIFGLRPEVSGLTPGIYTIRVAIIWTKEKHPYPSAPAEADLVEYLYGRIKYDPFYIVR